MNGLGWCIEIHGFVQGQGVRPALARLADQEQWTGSVRNSPSGVVVTLGAGDLDEAELERRIRSAHPALSAATMRLRRKAVEPTGGFRIEESSTDGSTSAPVPRDVAVCPECLREVHAPVGRRSGYGLISCPRCGPRFSIAVASPFDRSRTTLADFPLCPACRSEYASPTDRRQHAQTIGCLECGPSIWLTDRQQRLIASQDEACQIAAEALRSGQIVAVRGIGGYQLLTDATSEAAVSTLRHRKRRPTKPLAVMCRTVCDAERIAKLDAAAREALFSPANPIVIVPRRWESPLAAGVYPFLSDVGILLPTTAVHDRLAQLSGRPMICTSGNLEGEPLAVDENEAMTTLADVADLWLHHNRPIRHPLDDSVVRIMAGRAATIRLARGLAPLPLPISAGRPLMAMGGFQKSAFAWSNGAQAALGPHIGDLHNAAVRDRLLQSQQAVRTLYGIDSAEVIVDAHPDDAARLAIPSNIEPLRVWHHHAHIAAAMVEHGWTDGPVVGIAADGQGYGPDGGLWGGEVLWATLTGFRRVATIRPFALPGGEAAAVDSARVAVSLLSQTTIVPLSEIAVTTELSVDVIEAYLAGVRSRGTQWTSSLGRLFDGVARLVLDVALCREPGEPARRLEALCDPRADGCYDWALQTEAIPWVLDWRPAIESVMADRRRDIEPGVIAERFHRGVVKWMIAVHRRCPSRPLVVGGGVFQNRRMCELLVELWPQNGPPLGLPGVVPCNDGGLAAGQLAIAAAIKSSQ